MSRLPPLPDPPARGAVVARFFAAIGLAIGLVAWGARRIDVIDTDTLLVSTGLAVFAALVSLAFIGLTVADIWSEGRVAEVSLAGTVLLVLLTLAPPAALSLAAVHLPALPGVTTDPADPPEPPAPAAASRLPIELLAPPGERAELAAAAYPDITPLVLDASAVEAYSLARQTLGELGWKIVGRAEPATETSPGGLVATGHSTIVGLPFDFAIRLVPSEDGTRLDLTSMSRDPLPDLGENARNIRAFVAKLHDLERRPSAG